jgi:hypothetical protein
MVLPKQSVARVTAASITLENRNRKPPARETTCSSPGVRRPSWNGRPAGVMLASRNRGARRLACGWGRQVMCYAECGMSSRRGGDYGRTCTSAALRWSIRRSLPHDARSMVGSTKVNLRKMFWAAQGVKRGGPSTVPPRRRLLRIPRLFVAVSFDDDLTVFGSGVRCYLCGG